MSSVRKLFLNTLEVSGAIIYIDKTNYFWEKNLKKTFGFESDPVSIQIINSCS